MAGHRQDRHIAWAVPEQLAKCSSLRQRPVSILLGSTSASSRFFVE
jgi:hypothetical protein